MTGSVGKTGTKDLLGLMTGKVGRTILTSANQNNEVGVPLTLLSIEPDTSTVIVEMGMRGVGQIAALTRVAEPDVGLITNIHPVHLELLGSLENIAEAKAEVLRGLRPGGVGVVPADCTLLEPHVAAVPGCIVRFGLGSEGCPEVWADYERPADREGASLSLHWPGGEAVVRTPFVSRAKLENAVAAVAACFGAGLPVELCVKGLEEASFTSSRGDIERLGEWLVIDDTYNASPAAVKAALDELARISAEEGGRSVAVLGDMLELGPEAARYHAEIGTYAAAKGVRVLWGVGTLSRSTLDAFRKAVGEDCVAGGVEVSTDIAPVLDSLLPGDVVLFKASRSIKLEIMVEALRATVANKGLSGDSLSSRERAGRGGPEGRGEA